MIEEGRMFLRPKTPTPPNHLPQNPSTPKTLDLESASMLEKERERERASESMIITWRGEALLASTDGGQVELLVECY